MISAAVSGGIDPGRPEGPLTTAASAAPPSSLCPAQNQIPVTLMNAGVLIRGDESPCPGQGQAVRRGPRFSQPGRSGRFCCPPPVDHQVRTTEFILVVAPKRGG